MTRHLCWVAVLGVAALPDWATACRPGWRPVMAYPAPVYHPLPAPAPVYVLPPPVYVPAAPPPAPRIEPAAATPTPAPAPAPTRPPVVEAVRPAAATDTPRSPAPPPLKFDPTPPTPAPAVFPKLEVPVAPDFRPPAAKAPDVLIPPPAVPVPPALPDPRRPEAMPSLTLPPDAPVKDSTSRSSPLAAGPAVGVYVAAGPGKTGPGYRTVGFYNHTAADLSLLIEGQKVTLPAKTYLYAQLGPTFTWAVGGRAAARETVPDGAAGLDVVFRE